MMKSVITTALLALAFLLGSMLGVVADGANGEATSPSFVDLFIEASDYQREALARFITNKYPNLPVEILAAITKDQPHFFADLEPALEDLIATKYEGLGSFVQERLLAAPQLQRAVDRIIAEQYPDLIADLQALPPGPDQSAAAGKLIQEKYPQLLQDVITTLNEKYPHLLAEVQRRVLAKYPRLLADVTELILRKYPGFTFKLIAFLNQKYPDIVAEIIRILTAPPPEPAPAEDAEAPPPETSEDTDTEHETPPQE